MKEFQIRDNEAGQRFDKYLSKLLRNAPKSFFYKMLRKKNITLNGKKATGNEKLEAGDQVKLFLSDETFDKFSQQDKAARAVTTLDVLYEDADVLLINKPAGMLSQLPLHRVLPPGHPFPDLLPFRGIPEAVYRQVMHRSGALRLHHKLPPAGSCSRQ